VLWTFLLDPEFLILEEDEFSFFRKISEREEKFLFWKKKYEDWGPSNLSIDQGISFFPFFFSSSFPSSSIPLLLIPFLFPCSSLPLPLPFLFPSSYLPLPLPLTFLFSSSSSSPSSYTGFRGPNLPRLPFPGYPATSLKRSYFAPKNSRVRRRSL
jgi:hypothetical protein